MRNLIILSLLLSLSFSGNTQGVFEKYFTSSSLRLDYILAGNADTAVAYLHALKKEPFWGGSRTNLLDTFQYGQYFLKVYDKASGKLIYTRGFSDLFHEWQTTSEARKMKKAFSETVLMPYPKNDIRLDIYKRKRNEKFARFFSLSVDPNDLQINRDTVADYPTEKIGGNNDPSRAVDLVFIPEGYTQQEMDKFREDAKRFAAYLMSWAPFRDYKDKFNFWIVKAPSIDEGTDMPERNSWKRTLVNSSFNTFGTARYLTTQDVFKLRDVASNVPYDEICILVNTSRYGGGGIYNFYNLCTADNKSSEFVFCHEFGHAFASLADEYVEEDLQTALMYNLKVEPSDPNITTLVNFGRKWKSMVAAGTPIPTPATNKDDQTIGAFEGAGYLKKGIYRPAMDCSMRSVRNDYFCAVCRDAITKMILFYAQ